MSKADTSIMDFDFLFDAIPTPIMVIDRDTLEFRKVNSAALTFYGYSEEEFLKLRLPDIRPEKIQGEIEGMIARFDDPTLPDTPRLHLTKSGERKIVKVHARLVSSAGKPTILAAVTDITKETELQKDARAARAFLNNVVESLPIAIFAKDAETRQYVFYNSGAERIFGTSRADLLGNTSQEVFGPIKGREYDAQDQRALNAGPEGIADDSVIRIGNQQERTVRIKKVAIKDTEIGGREYILALAEDVTDERLREAKVTHLAGHDILTGLANRRQFQDRFKEFQRISGNSDGSFRIAIHYIDLDGFKSANDTWGHAVGDEILKEAANRMTRIVRKTDFAVRLGGDEFAIVQTAVSNQAEVRKLAGRLVKSLSQPYRINGIVCDIGASVGVCISSTQTPVSTILEEADRALYRAKREGKGRFVMSPDSLAGTTTQALSAH